MIDRIGTPPAAAGSPSLPFTPAVRAGDYLFLSGQLGMGADGRIVGDDVGTQLRECVRRIQELLERAGGDLSNIVKVTAWLVDKADFPAYNAAYRELLPAPLPARSTVVSELLVPGARVEVEVIAYLGK